ncbi:MAG: PKD domain-containing protein [bacterium]
MKQIIIIFVLLLQQSVAIAQWQNVGNAERIKAYDSEIKDFVISEDNKYIYTLDGNAEIKTWDYKTGFLLDTNKINLSNDYDEFLKNALSLSTDGKTYCVANWILYDYYFLKLQIIIYDIKNKNKIIETSIDSIRFDTQEQYNYELTFLDYDYQTDVVYCFTKKSGIGYPPYLGGSGGQNLIILHQDSISQHLYLNGGYVNLIFYNINKSFIFLSTTSTSWYTQHGSNYSNSSVLLNYSITNLINLKETFLPDFYHYSDNSGNNETRGIRYDFTSGLFNNNHLLLTEKNKIYSYSLDSVEKPIIYSINEFDNQKYYLVNSLNSHFFFAYKGNEISIFNFKNLLRYNIFKIDSSGSINKFKISLIDSTYYISDNKGQLLKFKNTDIFRLWANFQMSDSLAFTGDTINFTNTSLLNPKSYLWDFGDGTTSIETNPIHIYQDSGYFNIKLIAFDGTGSDTIIKNNIIHIFQNPKPDFEYTLSGNFPVNVSFKNLVITEYDSLVWDFGDGYKSKEFEPNHDYYFSNDYTVNLKVYKEGVLSEISKQLKIEVQEPELPSRIYYEFTDTIKKDAVALRGWEDSENIIVYQILEGNQFKHGAFKNFKELWNVNGTTAKEFFVKRNANHYSLFAESSLKDFNKLGENYKNMFFPNVNQIQSTRQHENYLTCSYSNNGVFSFFVLNSDNDSILKRENFVHVVEDFYFNFKKLNYFSSIYQEDIIDILICCVKGGNPPPGQYRQYSAVYMNGNRLSDLDNYIFVPDFNRLNDSTIVAVSNDKIFLYNSFGYQKVKNYEKPKVSEYGKCTIPNWTFKGLIIFSDSSYLVYGKWNAHPGYIIVKYPLEVIDSVILNDRFGSFEFGDIANDNNILFSGYKMTTHNNKSPYFVKTNDKLIRKLISGSENTIKKDDFVFNLISVPNPTNDITQIQFDLKSDAIVNLKLYNSFGSLMYKSDIQNQQAGNNSFSIDFTPYSIGYYYYVIEANGSPYLGKIVYLR